MSRSWSAQTAVKQRTNDFGWFDTAEQNDTVTQTNKQTNKQLLRAVVHACVSCHLKPFKVVLL